MKKLVSTAGLTKEEWLQWRTRGIGGSDTSIIAGINSYMSAYQLWQLKTGQRVPESADNEFTHFGTVLEPVIKKEFTRRTGLKVRNRRAVYQSDEHPFMLADLDGVVNDGGERCVFEAKTASAYKMEAWEKGIPLEYLYQVQHYLAVTGWRKAYVAALIGGNHFLYRVIERDEAMISKIIRMEQEFWENHVLPGIEPAMDGSETTREFLNETYAQAVPEVIELPEETLQLCQTYDDLSRRIDGLKEQREAVMNQMKFYLKEHEKGVVGDREITWKNVTTTIFDRRRMEKEHKELYDEYCTKSQYRRFHVA